jgi:hypothetical protein
MAKRFEEGIAVKVPKGTRAELRTVAAKRYETICGIARSAILKELQEARREEKSAA